MDQRCGRVTGDLIDSMTWSLLLTVPDWRGRGVERGLASGTRNVEWDDLKGYDWARNGDGTILALGVEMGGARTQSG
jgi:hypothetical protein